MKKYLIHERRNGTCTVSIDGHEVYDDAPYGNDKVVIFKDHDAAFEFIERAKLDEIAEIE